MNKWERSWLSKATCTRREMVDEAVSREEDCLPHFQPHTTYYPSDDDMTEQ